MVYKPVQKKLTAGAKSLLSSYIYTVAAAILSKRKRACTKFPSCCQSCTASKMQLFTSSREYHVRQLQNDDSYGKGKAAVSMPNDCWAAKYPGQGLKMEA